MIDFQEEFDGRFAPRPIQIRCGLDRYGFSHVLAARLGYSTPPRFFGNWPHGWIWWPAQTPEELMFDRRIRHKPHVVARVREQHVLNHAGFDKTFAGGLPFAYVARTATERLSGSLLVMPPHSGDASQIATVKDEYLSFIESVKEDYSAVCVCLHSRDATPDVIARIKKMGLTSIVGAKPNDANGLIRMRAIFDRFEYVTSNSLGSHIAYSMYAGCKTTISGPLYQWSRADLAAELQSFGEEHLERIVHYYSRSYIEHHFDYLIQETPIRGEVMEEPGAEFVGAAHLMCPDRLRATLRWDTKGQLLGYVDAGRARSRQWIESLARIRRTRPS